MSSGQTINNESVKGLTVKRNMKEKVLCIIVILTRVALYLFCLCNIFTVWFVKNTWVSRTESEHTYVTFLQTARMQTALIIILAFGTWCLLNAADQYITRILHKKLPFTDAEKTFNLKSGSDDMPECAETKTPNND